MQLQVDSDIAASTNVDRAVMLKGGNYKFHVLNSFVATSHKLEPLKNMKNLIEKMPPKDLPVGKSFVYLLD